MSKVTSDIKYLEGLAQGKEIDKDENLGKILSELIKAVSRLSEKVDDIDARIKELEIFNNSLLDGMDELDDLMESYFNSDIDLDDDLRVRDRREEEDEEDDFYEVTCQKCGHNYLATFEDFMSDDVICPVCGEQYSLSDDVLEKIKESEHDHD